MFKSERPKTPGANHFSWTLFAFVGACIVLTGLTIWQLETTSPPRWCSLALTGSPEIVSGCYNVLLKLLDIKDHAIIGLIATLAVTILCVVAVALGVRITAGGPGNTSVNIGADTTRVQSGDTSVEIPTPPSGETP